MLLEFSVENEKAFRQEVVLSLLPSNLKDAANGRVVEIGDETGTKALTSVVILGKNNGGKSTFIQAIDFVRWVVQTSANEKQFGNKIPFAPNRLLTPENETPTSYGVLFSWQGVVYDFAFSHTAERVTHEHLRVADQSPRFRKLYERTWDPKGETYEYTFGEALSGPKSHWQRSTRENALFLSSAVQQNSEELRIPFVWITEYIRKYSPTAETSLYKEAAEFCISSEDNKNTVIAFLASLDVSVADIEFEPIAFDEKFLNSTFSPSFAKLFSEIPGDIMAYRVFFLKPRKDGSLCRMPISAKSTGTRFLFGLAGAIFDALEHGRCLIIDEINAALHPLVVEKIVAMFSSTELNKKRAQLIFTTHDVSILAMNKMRRDQVWFIENDGFEAQLTPLSDYSPRKGEALDRGYLGGRYGGVPLISEIDA